MVPGLYNSLHRRSPQLCCVHCTILCIRCTDGNISRDLRILEKQEVFSMIWHNVRYSLRALAKTPGFTIAAVLTLALGIGANTAIWSLIDGVLLSPLPYENGERLVLLRQSAPKAEIDNLLFSVQEVYDYRDQNESLKGLVEHHAMTFTLLGRNEPQRVSTGVVSAEFFDVLGVQPIHGRNFRPDDDDLGAEAVLILSHEYWQTAFGGDPEIVGEVFEMNNRPHTVVGVLPAIPQFPVAHDVYMPTSACPFRAAGEQNMAENRSAFRGMTVFGRLQDGVPIDRAKADMDHLAHRFANDYPETYRPEQGYQMDVLPLRGVLTEGSQQALFLLMGTVLLVLLIACANVANLMLARLLKRERELAIRSALGAGRRQLMAQSMVEATLLTMTGGLLGLAFAYGGLDMLRTFVGRFTPRAAEVTIDGRVLVFTLAVALLTGLALGALPILSRRTDLASSMREGTGQSDGRERHRLRDLLVVAQVAVSLVLLVAAGLTLRSFNQLQNVDPGFQPERLLSAELSLNWSKYTSRETAQGFYDRLLGDVRSHPGVSDAAMTNRVPLAARTGQPGRFEIEGMTLADGALAPQMDPRLVTVDYFRTAGIPVLQGEAFQLKHDSEGTPVAIINRRLAQRYFGDRNPIGQRLRRAANNGQPAPWATIIGVVGDVRHYGLDQEAVEEVYFPVAQRGFASRILIRTSGDPEVMANQLKEIVWRIDPGQPVSNVATLEATRQASVASPRLQAALLGLFAALALIITAAGLAGVVAFSVGRRRREIGIRIALGARAEQVLGMVVGQGMRLVVYGLGLGLAVALLGANLLRDHLFEIPPRDPATYSVVVLTLLFTAALAALLPARQATRVAPTVALRSE